MLTNVDSLAKWIAGHRPAAVRLTCVLADGSEQALASPSGAHKWKKTALLAFNMHAVEVRLYDGAGALIGCERVGEEDEDDAPAPAVYMPPPLASVASGDVSAVASALAAAFVQVVRDTAAAQAEVHKEAFKQLSDVAKIANTAAKEANEAARQAKLQLETYIARREEELADREEELQEQGKTGEMLAKLAEGVGPDLVRKLMAGKVPPAVGGGPNGAT